MADDRRAILARRASFLAAALAGAGVGAAASGCASEQRLYVCLEPPPAPIGAIVPDAAAAPADETTEGGLPARSPDPRAPSPEPSAPSPRICLSEL